jgi:hypothetical protein
LHAWVGAIEVPGKRKKDEGGEKCSMVDGQWSFAFEGTNSFS